MAQSNRIWFEKTRLGGFKPVSWQGLALMLGAFGIVFYLIYRIFTPGGASTAMVMIMLLVTGAFHLIRKATTGSGPERL